MPTSVLSGLLPMSWAMLACCSRQQPLLAGLGSCRFLQAASHEICRTCQARSAMMASTPKCTLAHLLVQALLLCMLVATLHNQERCPPDDLTKTMPQILQLPWIMQPLICLWEGGSLLQLGLSVRKGSSAQVSVRDRCGHWQPSWQRPVAVQPRMRV